MADTIIIRVPDIGDFDGVEVIEVLVAPGAQVAREQSLITLESDKATMDVPSTHAGTVAEVHVEVGSKVAQGDPVVGLMPSAATDGPTPQEATEGPPSEEASATMAPEPDEQDGPDDGSTGDESTAGGKTGGGALERESPTESAAASPEASSMAVSPASPSPGRPTAPIDASPSVRRYARELAADLAQITGTGRKGRITREDVQTWVKKRLVKASDEMVFAGIAPIPEIDFSQYGPVEEVRLSKIKHVGAVNLHRAWLNVPHVTQHDEADVTELEAFRKCHSKRATEEGFKLTPLAFILKACAAALREYPDFNSSLRPSGEFIIRKYYYHIAIAVDTPQGLVVPVLRDVDKKMIWTLAQELAELGARARDRKLGPADMQGATFTVSNLGGLGGTDFTPIVNAPQVAILGVSRSQIKPQWRNDRFEPRQMLPLSLSYDHRVIDGAAGARFTRRVAQLLTDIRQLVL